MPTKKVKTKRKTKANSPRLVIRQLTIADLVDVQYLQQRAYLGLDPWTETQLRSQIKRFAEGQLCIELDGKVVAASSSLLIDMDGLDDAHTFEEISGGGTIDNHDPTGDMLYGIDIAVDPDFRGLKLARRLYDARKELAQRMNLRGIVFGGRMPGYQKHASKMSAAEYVAKVLRKELRDPVITAQRANGFIVSGLVAGYLPNDKESAGYAVTMRWANPAWIPPVADRRHTRSIRVASVQYQMRSIHSFSEFATQCEFFIDTASDYRCDFVLFPELLTNQLLALVPAERPGDSARKLHQFTDEYVAFFHHAAMRYNVNVIAGTHLTVEDDVLYNIAYLFHRDGRVDKQYKIHITPAEARWWGVSAGNEVRVFETDRGRVAIAICYDVEFPELGRYVKAKGAELLFLPYNTDIRSGHLRVRSCAAARAIENHMYVVTAGATGNLPQVEGADIHYAQSAILTPSDIPFARDGIAAEATPNTEAMLVHDLDLATLRRMESTGTVRAWLDRRKDLYSVRWRNTDEEI